MKILLTCYKAYIMKLQKEIKKIARNIESLTQQVSNEEGTKMSLILPFIKALGYDISNPADVSVETDCCSHGNKFGKIDISVMRDGKPSILIECKSWKEDLENHKSQLMRYFNLSEGAQLGILTNGIEYWFYTDNQTPNRMDKDPFMKIDLRNITNKDVEKLKMFDKGDFDINSIRGYSREWETLKMLRNIIENDFGTSSQEYQEYLRKRVCKGKISQKDKEQLTKYVESVIREKADQMLAGEKVTHQRASKRNVSPVVVNGGVASASNETVFFAIVKSILHTTVSAEELNTEQHPNHFGVYLKEHGKPCICQLCFYDTGNLALCFFADDDTRKWNVIKSLDEINDYADKIVARAKKYL